MEILMLFVLGAIATLICVAIYEYCKATEEEKKQTMALMWKVMKSSVKIGLLLVAIGLLMHCARGILSDSNRSMKEFVAGMENAGE